MLHVREWRIPPMITSTWAMAALALVLAFVAYTAGSDSPCVSAQAACPFDDDSIINGDWVLRSNTAFDVTVGHSATADAVLTIPDTAGAADTFVMTAQAQTLTNKTITAPALTSPVISGAPDATGSTWVDLGSVTTADINGGTVDGVTIGGAAAGAGTFTTLTGTTVDGIVGSIAPAAGSFTTGDFSLDVNVVGDVGIDQATPADDLHIGDGSESESSIRLHGNRAVNDTIGFINAYNEAASAITSQIRFFRPVSANDDGLINIRTANGGVLADALTIDESQNSNFHGNDIIGTGGGELRAAGNTFSVDTDLQNNNLTNVGDAGTDFTSTGVSFGVDVDANSNDVINLGHSETDFTSTGIEFGVDTEMDATLLHCVGGTCWGSDGAGEISASGGTKTFSIVWPTSANIDYFGISIWVTSSWNGKTGFYEYRARGQFNPTTEALTQTNITEVVADVATDSLDMTMAAKGSDNTVEFTVTNNDATFLAKDPILFFRILTTNPQGVSFARLSSYNFT